MQGDEPCALAWSSREPDGIGERVDDPGIAEQLSDEPVVAVDGSDSIGDRSQDAGLSGEVVCFGFVFGGRVRGEESDSIGQSPGVFQQVVAQRFDFVDDDPLSGLAQGDIDQGCSFEIDFEEIRDAALDEVPGRVIRGASSLEDFSDAQPDAFLSAFEFFEDSDPSLVCAALFSSGRDQLDGFVLLSEQSIAFVACFCHVGFDRFEASFGFVHSCLP